MHLRNTRTVLATKQQDWTTNRIHTHVRSGCWLLSGHFLEKKSSGWTRTTLCSLRMARRREREGDCGRLGQDKVY